MSLNRYKPHLFIVPEDDANRQLATGFTLHHGVDIRKIQVLNEAGGWTAVLDVFENDHVASMRQYRETRFLLLMDFDGDSDRLQAAQSRIPADLRDRVFILGAWTEPEDLRNALGISLEEIGELLASGCCDDTYENWDHQLLHHNSGELNRLREGIRTHLLT